MGSPSSVLRPSTWWKLHLAVIRAKSRSWALRGLSTWSWMNTRRPSLVLNWRVGVLTSALATPTRWGSSNGNDFGSPDAQVNARKAGMSAANTRKAILSLKLRTVADWSQGFFLSLVNLVGTSRTGLACRQARPVQCATFPGAWYWCWSIVRHTCMMMQLCSRRAWRKKLQTAISVHVHRPKSAPNGADSRWDKGAIAMQSPGGASSNKKSRTSLSCLHDRDILKFTEREPTSTFAFFCFVLYVSWQGCKLVYLCEGTFATSKDASDSSRDFLPAAPSECGEGGGDVFQISLPELLTADWREDWRFYQPFDFARGEGWPGERGSAGCEPSRGWWLFSLLPVSIKLVSMSPGISSLDWDAHNWRSECCHGWGFTGSDYEGQTHDHHVDREMKDHSHTMERCLPVGCQVFFFF